jgi:leucyl/phenylalanyl-tRNA--protein transferase
MTRIGTQQSTDNRMYWVRDNVIAADFPDVSCALRDPDGLLAIGGDLEPARLLGAYRRAIFPWYSAGQPILWWSPDPRCVLEPANLHISRSLRKRLRNDDYRVTFNSAFEQVLSACAAPRDGNRETWLTPDMAAAYLRLHRMGHCISIECWHGDLLSGGLYGVVLGRVFFGESMFSRQANASKIALTHLVHELRQRNFRLIDCQVHSRHLQSLGATPMPRQMFVNVLRHYCEPDIDHAWPAESVLP